jgi:hypothetical protein
LPAQHKKVAKMDWMTKLVPADGGDAGIAIVDARPLKRIAQDIWPARPCPGKRRWSARPPDALARW